MLVRALLVACLVAAAAAVVHQAAVALGVLELGTLPGEGSPADGLVGAGIVALLVGGVGAGLALLVDERDRVPAARLVALLDLAAAAFVLGRFFAFDPYYLPTLRRYSEGGNLGGAWIALVVAGLVVAAAATFRRPRTGAALSAPTLLFAALTAVLTGIGH